MISETKSQCSRWRYSKRIDHFSGEIVSLYRVRGLDVQILRDGKWVSANYRRWFDIIEDPEFEWLTRQETTNLHNFLRSGQEGIPPRLDLQPRERYKKWKCPNCQTFTVIPIVIGYPNPEDMEAEMEGHIILQGCTVYGDEPEKPVACTACGWFGEQIRGNSIRGLPPSKNFGRERREEDQ